MHKVSDYPVAIRLTGGGRETAILRRLKNINLLIYIKSECLGGLYVRQLRTPKCIQKNVPYFTKSNASHDGIVKQGVTGPKH